MKPIWRLLHLYETLVRRLQSDFPSLYQWVAGHRFYPPFRRNVLRVSRIAGLGDVLMCTPALRESKRLNPKTKICFYTNFPELVSNLSYIDEVLPAKDIPEDTIWLDYSHCIPPKRHIAELFAEQLGITLLDVRPDCNVNDEVFAVERKRLPAHRPVVLVNRRAGYWTPNKDWPSDYWDALLPQLCVFSTVVEVGEVVDTPNGIDSANYFDRRGTTSLEELVALIALSDLHIGPVSGPVHVAAALRIPSVVIYGGYEDPVCAAYPGNINLVGEVACSPCWLRAPCPLHVPCLKKISVDEVLKAVTSALQLGRIASEREG